MSLVFHYRLKWTDGGKDEYVRGFGRDVEECQINAEFKLVDMFRNKENFEYTLIK